MKQKKNISSTNTKTGTDSTLQDIQRKKNSFDFTLVYRGFEFLPLWNWAKVGETKDLRYLYRVAKEGVDNLSMTSELVDIHKTIIKEVAAYTDSLTYKNYLDKTAELLNLRNQYNIISDCLIALRLFESNKEADKLVKKYFPNYKGVNDLENQLKGLKKKIILKNADYEARFAGKDEKKEDVYKVLGMLGTWKHCVISPFDITLKQYLSLIKEYNEAHKPKSFAK